MKTKKLLLIIAILFIALISGCSNDDFKEVVGVCPVVSATSPIDGASGVPLNQIITVTFNEDIDPATINQSSFIVTIGTTPVAGTVSHSGKIATFTPASPLAENTLYTGRITTFVKDVTGNALQTDYIWTFTTGLIPLVASTDPANLAIDVALNKVITATFNMSMNPLTLNATTFTVKQGTTTVLGAITYAGTMVSFTPSLPLAENKVYTCTITKGAKNLSGIELAADYVWTFTSGILPKVVSTDPINNAIGVALNKSISATFNMPMNALTLGATAFTVKQGDISVLGIITYSESTVTFTPSIPLTGNTIYTCTITTDAKNLAGTALASNYIWSFTTSLLPIVVSTDPVNNATGIALNKSISVTFNMPMNALTLTNTAFTVKQGAATVVGTIIYAGLTATFTPTIPLTANTVYTCTITPEAKNLAGAGLASNYVWKFTTSLSPIVVATDPVNNDTGEALTKSITATFNMPMNASTLSATTFTVKQGITAIAGTISYLGTTVTFNPTTALTSNKTYTCTITTGAKNMAGIGLANDYIWNFTTIVPIVVIPPPVTTSNLFFGIFGGNAGVTNQGLFTKINGTIGTTAAATLITGFKDGVTGDVYTVTPLNNGLVTGGIFAAPPAPGNATNAATALAGLNAARAAYLSISPASMPGGTDPGAGELGGLTLAPSIYKSASGTFKITNGDLTLDAQGDPNAIFVFQCAAALTVGDSSPSSVKLINGALAKNVYWYVGSAAVINYAGGGVMTGNIMANSGVTLSSPANSTNSSVTTLNGRAISLVASVTMVNTVINVPN
ncbi:Ig-like domain-containing protein [Flavobacterium restrictum]|uniref:Ig-like domain-containing protein n=1 Tax=Flavobacterium restrictum TaxID=2594428 RepID=UPI001F1C7F37|nr:Ig-like domain-containing protein [Flavobacterium restrictum]